MKKFLFIMLLILLLLFCTSLEALSIDRPQDISIQVNGVLLSPDVSPIVRDGRTYVPLYTIVKGIADEIQAKCHYI